LIFPRLAPFKNMVIEEGIAQAFVSGTS